MMMMMNTILYCLVLSTFILLIDTSAEYPRDNEDYNAKLTSQDYNGPWGEGVKCPFDNPAFPLGTTVYKGTVPAAMTTDAVNYLRDSNVTMFQISDIKTYPILINQFFVLRKEFHTWHYSNGKLLTGCWTGVTVYQCI
ncbi:hypothetical protein I4U23_023306 [Adineta vaga]|nr:hypothetical protein I4U23_023306 [Adineta vaga]